MFPLDMEKTVAAFRCDVCLLSAVSVWSFMKKKKNPTPLCVSMPNVDTRGTCDAKATTILADWSLRGTCGAWGCQTMLLLHRCARFPPRSPLSGTS